MIERKQVIQSATPCLVFLSYTIAVLARSCRFVKSQTPNPYALDELNIKPDNEEVRMLINTDHD